MIELNEYECEMLDAVLEAFGIPDSLTRPQLLELFDQDEATAFALVQILTREGFIAETGKHGDYDLPEKLVLKPKGDKFLKAGGFVRRHKAEQEKPVEVNGTLSKLQQQNMKLQNEKLLHQSQLRDVQTNMEKRQYLLYALIVIALIIGYFIGHAVGAHGVKK
ncbi:MULTISPECIES: hypothetical protein [unclassified Mucilaginibacter]|uniref:hypothetical protein n=1 Tax=unclassified Mucilaginibacter TaxID=2617802 RepID=UPI002AC9D66F|nr:MULTISPECIES: hypothetical protein [unclassified Mucilaginibacter]MEB0263235.1 hypothetical protein [Mucilaginibacter sp. 10I4]MEB0280318.1 hypothetical protein [Mucilaginibacter sp. 10B2]MEB0300263.1 hypothetical protein [Mucilaginibacter sp. 5C4]WPX25620.1 hypothetical protein RHM67_10115 [Mucilaginibacter sp. 5C4]